MKTTLYYAELSVLHDEELFRQYYLTLPPCRREKIDRIKPEGERCRSLGAGLLLKKACEEYGIPGEDGYLLTGEYGKPAFAARPEVHFSLSHSGKWAMCAVARYNIGCDVQEIKPFHRAVAKRVFTEEECSWLADEEKQGRGEEAFCRLWTLKESFLKATGKGFAFPAQEASFSFNGDAVRFQLNGEKTDAYSFYQSNELPGYTAALCLQTDRLPQLEIKYISL